MKNWSRSTFHLAIYLLALAIGQANAAGFADAFRSFVLEDDIATEMAIAPTTVTLPSNSQSAACMQCHNGNRGTAIRLKHADAAMSYSNHRNVDHPVGMSYTQYASRQPHSYTKPSQLDSRIQLENGQVTCTSCHGVKQTLPEITSATLLAAVDDLSVNGAGCTSTKTLTTGPDTGSLCMSCHAM